MSRSDSDFESSNVNLKENKPDGVNLNSNDIDYYVRKNKRKFYGFRQTTLRIIDTETNVAFLNYCSSTYKNSS